MRTGKRGFPVLLILVGLAGNSFAAHTITSWPENKAGAVSLAFDDGCQSHASLGIPALDARGLKGTFFLVINDIGGYSPAWSSWKNAAITGHEIASHTMSHPYLTSLSLTQVQSELAGAQAAIDAQIPSRRCLSFAYPYGALNSSVASIARNIYIASRGISCGLNSEPIDFSNVSACSPDDGDDIYAQADAAEQQGKWLVAFIHSLDGGRDCWGSWEIDMWTTYLDYLKDKNLWVGTFGAAAKHIQERASATLSVLSSSSDQMVLSLTDTLDDAIYDQPLTIRSEVPSDWGTVSVQQGSGSITQVPSTVEGTARVIYHNAVPDRGLISLRNPQAGNPQISALAPQFITAGSPGFALQVTGGNFVSGAKVRWNGSDRVTTFGSAAQLQASITTADIATPGTVPVTVLNPDGGLSNAMTFEVRNPLPAIIGLSPSWATAGGPSFSLTVDGSNFVSGSKVRWKGSDRVTSFISGTEIHAAIAATDIATAGTASVTVSNPAPGGGISNGISFDILPVIVSLTVNPSNVVGGNTSTGTVTLNGPAPSGGAVASLSSGNTPVASVPANVTVAGGNTSAAFTITTTPVSSSTVVNISALYGGATRSSSLTVNPARSVSASGGTPQSAIVNTAFTTPLQATVTDSGTPVGGVTVTFTAPGSGAGGAFSGGSLTANAVTNSNGVATAPTLTANGQAGTYTVTAGVSGVATPAVFSLTNNPVTANGSLSGSGDSSTTTANLTTEGGADWVHWGDSSLNRKAGVTAQLGTYTAVGGGTVRYYANDPRPLNWTDGTPWASSTNNKNGVYVSGVQNGFSITAPADTGLRTLKVHVGGWYSGGTLTAHLSDGSAPDFVNVTTAVSGQYDRNYTLTYKAGEAGQSLTVKWIMTSGTGNVTLNGAALQ
ncbi:MAG: polysaccharide deacetylase family protein [Deltaproteobacteria bacterium]|nr:polysaccharide deacetylase family protein [Deltaproteobacteria bacterium]